MTLVINSTKFNEATSPTTSSQCPPSARVSRRFAFRTQAAPNACYLARRAEAVYVLHAFQKKTQATLRKDLEIAKGRFRQLLGGRI
jgi:hypothetical protein